MPETFALAWSADHLAAIERLEKCVLHGGQFAFAMPRGSGKTALCEAGVLWATLYGHRRFVVFVGSSADAALDSLTSIKSQVETNDLLHEDFGELTHYVRALEGNATRANMQTLGGVRTRLGWKGKKLAYPVVPGSVCAGIHVQIAGMDGRIRGRKADGANGESLRPDLVIVDDPQTDESAHSPNQNAKREKILNGAVLGLAGPKTRIAAFVPCTVIAPGDMADRILDRERYPVWQGQRSRMVLAWPADAALWDQYADMRKASQRAGGDGREANDFYRANRGAMDAGAEVGWPERFNAEEDSAIQHAQNLKIDRGARAFQAEFQNDPQPELAAGQLADLCADEIAAKVNRVQRGATPPDCPRLTAFVDCSASVLWWCVCGWSNAFGGSVVDYGTYPRQNRAYFTQADARPALADQFPTYDESARLYAGLKAVTGELLGRAYPVQGGGESRLALCMVDAGWLGDTVHRFCRESAYAALLRPSKGYGIGAAGAPMGLWQKKPGEVAGDNWRTVVQTGGGYGRLVLYDTNHWKTFTAQRLLTPEGGAGSLKLFGEPDAHQLFADHCAAEYRVQTEGRGRKVEEWKARPDRRDNHWWDCLVGCAVGASVAGLQWDSGAAAGEPPRQKPEKRRIKLSELYAKKNGGQRR